MEKHVVSLDLAKKLHEAGIKRESMFNWNVYPEIPRVQEKGNFGGMAKDMSPYLFPAYLASELGDLIPEDYPRPRHSMNYLVIHKIRSGWKVSYFDIVGTAQMADTLAEAMGLMLLYLVENGLLSVKEINKYV